jgi:hypothetical protein
VIRHLAAHTRNVRLFLVKPNVLVCPAKLAELPTADLSVRSVRIASPMRRALDRNVSILVRARAPKTLNAEWSITHRFALVVLVTQATLTSSATSLLFKVSVASHPAAIFVKLGIGADVNECVVC